MGKIRKLIAASALAICGFVVLGTRANAEVQTSILTPDKMWTNITTSKTNPDINPYIDDNSIDGCSVKYEITSGTKTFQGVDNVPDVIFAGGSRTLTITISNSNNESIDATISLNAYATSDKTIKIDNVAYALKKNVFTEINADFTNSTKIEFVTSSGFKSISVSYNKSDDSTPKTYSVTVKNGEEEIDFKDGLNNGYEYTLPNALEKDGYTFDGWDVGGTIYNPGEVIEVSKNLIINAKWTKITSSGEGLVFNVSTADLPATINSETIVDGTIFTLIANESTSFTIDNGSREIDNFSFTKRLKTVGTSTNDGRTIKFYSPNKGVLKVYAMSGNKTEDRKLVLSKDSFDVNSENFNSFNGSNLQKYEYPVESAGTYFLGSANGGINIYYVEFIPTTAEIKLQYDTVSPSDATKIRLIGEINISDVTKINTAKFVVSVNGAESIFECTKLYKKVSSCSLLGGDHKYYIVFTIEGIENAILRNVILETIDLNITLIDGTTLNAPQRTNITLGKM